MRGETDRMALQQYKVFVWRYDTTIFKFEHFREKNFIRYRRVIFSLIFFVQFVQLVSMYFEVTAYIYIC